MTSADYFNRKPSSSIRPGLSHLQANPSSPHTPTGRTVSSALSSPSLSYRAEEEVLIFELGARHFSAGFAGESSPRCRLGFGPEESRRVGDYRKWLPGYDDRPRKKMCVSKWGEDQELWRMDLRGFNLGIVEDKVERAVREAYTKHLLLDSKSRRMLLILPSVIPHQLLSTVLSTLFENFQPPSITLLSPPVLATAAAGCRSSLVVDIGWSETIITGTYEYREVSQSRTTRAMRLVTLEMAKLLERHDHRRRGSILESEEEGVNTAEEPLIAVDLEQAEEVTTRLAWCKRRRRSDALPEAENIPPPIDKLSIVKDKPEDHDTEHADSEDDVPISIPSPSSPRQSIHLPFSALASPIETVLLANKKSFRDLDDHEQPLHLLIYKSLLSLPPDVRAVCMSRIIFTGGGSYIPGLKGRLLDEIFALVEKRGWDPVLGKVPDERKRRLREISGNRRNVNMGPDGAGEVLKDPPENLPASLAPQVIDPMEEKLLQDRAKGSKLSVSGVVRGVETLGAWAGGSLLAGLSIKGVVEIEKDTFLQHGLPGARKDAETSILPQKNIGLGIQRAGIGERTSWTLGGWA